MNGQRICFSNRICHRLHHLMKNSVFGLMNVNGGLKKQIDRNKTWFVACEVIISACYITGFAFLYAYRA